jgi:hypothetical protein
MIISHDPTGGLTREKAYHALLDELFLPVKLDGVVMGVTLFNLKIE